MFQLCTRNCFFGEFANEAGCAQPKVWDLEFKAPSLLVGSASQLKVVDLPEQQASVWNVSKICNLAIEGIIIENKR